MLRQFPAIIAALGLVPLLATAAGPHGVEQLRVGSHSLAEWRRIIQHLDPQNPASAEKVPGLIELIQDTRVPWFNRRQAALTLGRMGEKAAEAVPVLRSLLSVSATADPDRSATRLWSAKALALMGPTSAAASKELAQIATDRREDLLLRLTALEALGRIGANSAEVLPTFIQSLSENAPADDDLARLQLRIAAAEGLGLLGPAAAPVVPHLIRACQDESALLRLPAARSLGEIGPAAELAIPVLVDMVLFDEVPEVADAAAKSLGGIGSPALQALQKLLADRAAEVRLRAVWGLTAMGLPARETLAEAVGNPAPLVSAWAAEGLLTIGTEHPQPAVARLIELLEDDERNVRIKAYRTLLAHPGLVSAHTGRLHALARSERSDVRRAAIGLLEASSGRAAPVHE